MHSAFADLQHKKDTFSCNVPIST